MSKTNKTLNNTEDTIGEKKEKVYIVQKGDSLMSISEKFLGEQMRYNEIKELNELENDWIKIGQKLRIPTEGNE